MFFEVFVYCLLCLLLVAYSFNTYKKTQKAFVLAILSLQIIATVVQISSIFYSSVVLHFSIQFFIFMFGIIIPAILFFANYTHINLYEIYYTHIGDILMNQEKFDAAIEKYQKALVENPKEPELYVKLGKAYNAIGDPKTAFDRFAKAVELNRNDYRSYYEIGVIFNDMNKKKDAELMLDNSLRIKPDYTDASKLLAEVLCAENKFDDAIHVYQEAIKYAPDNFELYYQLGIVHTELRDFNDALENYKSVVKINPQYYEAYFSIGQIYLLKGEFDKAIEAFKNSIFDREISGRAYYQMAKVYMLKENEIAAVEHVQKAIDVDPTYRYKAEKEPLFKSISEYLEGIQMVSNAQMKLEQGIDEKVKEKFEKEYSSNNDKDNKKNLEESGYTEEDLEKVHFNYFDKFNS